MSENANLGLATDLNGKVVVITGASSGIGRYAAIEFAKLGSKQVLVGRRQDALDETKKMCLAAGATKEADIHLVIASLEDPEQSKKVVSETISKFGQLDVLVNNAGMLVGGSIETVSLDDYDKQMNINVRSMFVITQAAVPHLKKTKGSIVNVSSLAGLRAFPGALLYCMSKSAVDQMTRCVALELAPFGVRSNAVNPAVIITNFHRNAGMNEEAYENYLKKAKETHPLGRPGNADEVAKSIVFLASSVLSGFMTGVTLAIDGGRGVGCP